MVVLLGKKYATTASNFDGLDRAKQLTTSFVESGLRYYLYHVGSFVK